MDLTVISNAISAKPVKQKESFIMKTKRTHGGSRPNSGRPKGQPTKTLSYRVPVKHAAKIDKKIREVIAAYNPPQTVK